MNPILEKAKIKFFKPKESIRAGLNIGVSSVKLVKLKVTPEAAEVCGVALSPAQDMESALRGLAQEQGLKRVNISVSGQQSIIRYIDFPKMTAEELKQSIKFEAQKHIPFPVSEVNLDACILKDLRDNKMRVLVAAVKKELLSQRLKLLKDIGLDVDVVDIDSLALINAFNYSYSQEPDVRSKTIALLNIGSATSNLNILEDGLPALSRDITVGGNNFTQRIADALGIDFTAAEEVKTGAGSRKDAKVASAAEQVLAKLAQDVRTSFDFYESRSVTSVEKIYVSGGASLFPGLQEALANFLGLEVAQWDPFRKISVAPGLDTATIQSSAGQLAVAAGLALRA